MVFFNVFRAHEAVSFEIKFEQLDAIHSKYALLVIRQVALIEMKLYNCISLRGFRGFNL